MLRASNRVHTGW